MLISTKGRYAIRVLCDLASNDGLNKYVGLPEIAQRQDISLKYLERIMLILVKGKLLKSTHGKGGGYMLVKDPGEYTILEILELTEDSLAPVECLKHPENVCKRKSICPTLNMWKETHEILSKYFSNKTIADLINK
ncbi:MAG: Rrf2 family transcriptional regulator [Erysipelotrichaceae bacterium]|nr:Rrf2 family transcriptional regulator [Erysipelotrichaceae bacterium]